MTLKSASAEALNIVEFEGDQLEIDFSEIGFDLDRPQFSICPKCSSDLIRLADGCGICGWSESQSPPSKISPTKSRRRKGEGTGYIYRRTVTRKGTQYQESYYRYRDESGKLKSKYIPRKLIDRVQDADNSKLPVTDVLKLLGGLEISRGEQFSTSAAGNVPNSDKSDELISINRGEQASPPCTKNLTRPKRQQGYGAGYIECRKVKRGSKLYSQFWYHYEIWSSGDRVVKKSRYIPKRLVPKVERMNGEKVAVSRILEVLGVKE